MEMIGWILFVLFVAPISCYLCAKLGTYGVLKAKWGFKQNHSFLEK